VRNPYVPAEAAIHEIREQTSDTRTYTMSFVDPRTQVDFTYRPGQFNMITIPGYGEAPISFSSEAYRRTSFDHTIRNVGTLTQAMFDLAPGDVVGVRGPFGSAWPVEQAKGRDVVIVCGGIGLAPLRPVIMEILNNRQDYGALEILYGSRSPDLMLFTDEFQNWSKAPDTRLLLSADPKRDGTPWENWPHRTGVVTVLLEDMKITPRNSIVMVCGPEIMMRFVVRGLLQRKFFSSQIYVSLERRMHCGIGKCGHCQIGPKFVCQDGPVLPYSEARGLPDLML